MKKLALHLTVLFLMVAGLVVSFEEPAAAAPLFQMPFSCGETWRAATYSGHGTANDYPIDLNHDNGDSWELGHPVVASAGGTVTAAGWDTISTRGYYVVIDHGGGWSTEYYHLYQSPLVSSGQVVSVGQHIGGVGGTGGSGFPVHLHYEQRYLNVPQHVAFNGQSISYTYTYNGYPYTSANCTPITPSDQDADGTPDSADYCPYFAGISWNGGCPEDHYQVTGDFNGDGYDDIAAIYDVGNPGSRLWVFEGTSSGPSTPTNQWQDLGFTWEDTKPVTGDFNGDGYDDLVFFYDVGDPYTRIWLFNGSATGFNGVTPINHWQDPGWTWETIKPVAGDFNGDGYDDIAAIYDVGNPGTRIWVFPGTASGPGEPAIAWEDILFTWESIKPVTGDFNGDGYDDLVFFYDVGDPGTRMWLFNGSSSGLTGPVIRWEDASWTWEAIKPVSVEQQTAYPGQLQPVFTTLGAVNRSDIAVFYDVGDPGARMWLFSGTSTGPSSSPVIQWEDVLFTWEAMKPVSGNMDSVSGGDVAVFYDVGNPATRMWYYTGSTSGPSNSPVIQWQDTGWTWEAIRI